MEVAISLELAAIITSTCRPQALPGDLYSLHRAQNRTRRENQKGLSKGKQREVGGFHPHDAEVIIRP